MVAVANPSSYSIIKPKTVQRKRHLADIYRNSFVALSHPSEQLLRRINSTLINTPALRDFKYGLFYNVSLLPSSQIVGDVGVIKPSCYRQCIAQDGHKTTPDDQDRQS